MACSASWQRRRGSRWIGEDRLGYDIGYWWGASGGFRASAVPVRFQWSATVVPATWLTFTCAAGPRMSLGWRLARGASCFTLDAGRTLCVRQAFACAASRRISLLRGALHKVALASPSCRPAKPSGPLGGSARGRIDVWSCLSVLPQKTRCTSAVPVSHQDRATTGSAQCQCSTSTAPAQY